jgi:hypothetical protein
MLRLVALVTAFLLSVGACSAAGPKPTPASSTPAMPAPTRAEPPTPASTDTSGPSPVRRPAPVDYLVRHGSDLLLGDEPFREISFNKFDLLQFRLAGRRLGRH